MPWSRRNFLTTSSAGLLSLGARAAVTPPEGPRYFISVFAEGGWDVTIALDPKLGSPTIDGPEVDATGIGEDVEEIQTFGGIDVIVNNAKRPRVTDFFTRWHSRTQVIRGIWMGAIAHDPCRFRLFTGTQFPTVPDLPTIVGYSLGLEEPLGTLDMSGWSLSGALAASSGRIGYQSQLRALVDPTTIIPSPTGSDWQYPIFQMSGGNRASVSRFLSERAEEFGLARADGGHNDQYIADLVQSWMRSERFREQSGTLMQNLVYGQKPDLDLQVSLAVDMLQAGLCRTMSLATTYRWDTHANNANQHAHHDDLFDKLDLLATELDARGMLDQTLVAVISEMSRTPKLNAEAGKDHWPHTTALFFGGGIRGSTVTGQSNDLTEAMPVDLKTGEPDEQGMLLKYNNLAAGVLQWMDVDPERWLPGVTPFGGFAS